MEKYICVKIIESERQMRNNEEGYKVVYPDGYVSWSPKDVFEEAYHKTNGMTFGLAIEAMKQGFKVARSNWNGKGMWLALSGTGDGPNGGNMLAAEGFWNPHSRKFAEENGGQAEVLPLIIMKTATGEILMGWLASQTDMLADDWEVVN